MVIALDWRKVEGIATGEATLLNAVTSTDNGEWVNTVGLGPFTIHITGIVSGDKVRAHGSNKVSAPADGDSEAPIGSDITDATKDSMRQYSGSMTWFKVSFPDNSGGGTITVVMRLRNKQ